MSGFRVWVCPSCGQWGVDDFGRHKPPPDVPPLTVTKAMLCNGVPTRLRVRDLLLLGWWVDGLGWCPTRNVLHHALRKRFPRKVGGAL